MFFVVYMIHVNTLNHISCNTISRNLPGNVCYLQEPDIWLSRDQVVETMSGTLSTCLEEIFGMFLMSTKWIFKHACLFQKLSTKKVSVKLFAYLKISADCTGSELKSCTWGVLVVETNSHNGCKKEEICCYLSSRIKLVAYLQEYTLYYTTPLKFFWLSNIRRYTNTEKEGHVKE